MENRFDSPSYLSCRSSLAVYGQDGFELCQSVWISTSPRLERTGVQLSICKYVLESPSWEATGRRLELTFFCFSDLCRLFLRTVPLQFVDSEISGSTCSWCHCVYLGSHGHYPDTVQDILQRTGRQICHGNVRSLRYAWPDNYDGVLVHQERNPAPTMHLVFSARMGWYCW